MKAEQKKALNENTIVHGISSAYTGIKHGPSRGTLLLLFAVGAVLIAGVTFRYFYHSTEAATSERWLKLDEIVFPEQLTTLTEDSAFMETPQGRLLRFKRARLLLSDGMRDLGANPSLARKNVEDGTKLYEELAQSAGRVPLLHQEALWGSAKGLETLNEIDKARSYYERLKREYGNSAMGKDAAAQLDRLDSDAGKKEVSELHKILAPSDR